MEYRVMLTVQGAPPGYVPSDLEQATQMLDGLLAWLLHVAPDSGAVVDACAGEPGINVTFGLDAPDATVAVYTATRILERALGGTPDAQVTAIAAEAVETDVAQLAS